MYSQWMALQDWQFELMNSRGLEPCLLGGRLPHQESTLGSRQRVLGGFDGSNILILQLFGGARRHAWNGHLFTTIVIVALLRVG